MSLILRCSKAFGNTSILIQKIPHVKTTFQWTKWWWTDLKIRGYDIFQRNLSRNRQEFQTLDDSIPDSPKTFRALTSAVVDFANISDLPKSQLPRFRVGECFLTMTDLEPNKGWWNKILQSGTPELTTNNSQLRFAAIFWGPPWDTQSPARIVLVSQKPKLNGQNLEIYPLVNKQIAIENGHWNSWFTH